MASVKERLREKFDALQDAAEKLRQALLVTEPKDRPNIRGKLRRVENEALKVKARIDTITATSPVAAPGAAEDAALTAAIAAVGRAQATSAGVNGLVTATLDLIKAYQV